LCDSGEIYRFSKNTRWHATVIPVYQDWRKNVLLFMQLQNVFLFSWKMVLIRIFPESFSNFKSFCERIVLYWVIVMDVWWQSIHIYENVTIKRDVHVHCVHVMYNIHWWHILFCR
jgi:hypothetical protein